MTRSKPRQPRLPTTTQPQELIDAAKAQAERDGMTFSEWVGDCLTANLDADLAATVPERRPAHRPKLAEPAAS